MNHYYSDTTGTSPRLGRDWVRVLPVPNRYPQDMEMVEVQQVVLYNLLTYNTPYEVVSGLRATISGDSLLTISNGIVWCAIGVEGLYIDIPHTQIVIPPNDQVMHQLGVELVKDVVGAGYDPILGGIYPLLWDTPMDRVRVYARYVWDTPDTLPVLTIRGGVIHYYSGRRSNLSDTLISTYMRELDGDYIAYGLGITYANGWVNVGSGRAWVRGRPIEVQAQSIPYRDGLLQLCSDGTLVIESSYEPYAPEYSVVVSSDNTPILMGNHYGVVLPYTTPHPYLAPVTCIPLATLVNGEVIDIAARLPTDAEILSILSDLQSKYSISNQLGDPTHPLYRVREVDGVIYLPRSVQALTIPQYTPPHTLSMVEESTVRTDWIDSSPTPSTPPPPPPFVYVEVISGEYKVYGYNLSPNSAYTPNPAPTRVLRGAMAGASVTTDSNGMLEYISNTAPIDLSGIIPTTVPNLSVGVGQSFNTTSPMMLGALSLYLRAGYYGVVSICALQNDKPYGAALAWVGVSSPTAGWLDIPIGPIHLPPGKYALISQSIVGSVLGRRHYLLPTLSGTPETTGSMNMLLSQDGVWESLPNMDLIYKVHRASPTSTYRDRFTTLEWGEAFDGYEYIPNYYLAPGTYITCTANSKEGGYLLGKVFPPRTSITISEALFGTDTLFPTIGNGKVNLYITSKTGTWISREMLVGQYTTATVMAKVTAPEGSEVKVYINSASGWVAMPVVGQGQGITTYRIAGLSPTTSTTDINGVVRQVLRERVRVRIELSTVSPEIQPYVQDINIITG